MPLCGFNQEMIGGLAGFHKGLVEHGILERSEKKKQTTEQTINIELKDMSECLKETHNINDDNMRELTEALVRYSCAFLFCIIFVVHVEVKFIQELNYFIVI